MNSIEEYFNNNKFDIKIYEKNEEYNIKNKSLFKIMIDINVWANDIKLEDYKSVRPEQTKFDRLVASRYKRCIVTSMHIPKECNACHIIPVKYSGSYDIDNGLLINASHHLLFDNFLWSINPDTLCIDVMCEDEKVVGSILPYKGKKLDIVINNIVKLYLRKRWIMYLENKEKYELL